MKKDICTFIGRRPYTQVPKPLNRELAKMPSFKRTGKQKQTVLSKALQTRNDRYSALCKAVAAKKNEIAFCERIFDHGDIHKVEGLQLIDRAMELEKNDVVDFLIETMDIDQTEACIRARFQNKD